MESIQQVEAATRHWLAEFVIAHQLCPFAAKPFAEGRVRIVVTDSARAEFLLEDLLRELRYLDTQPVAKLETTLLVHPGALEDFYDYNDFLDLADDLLVQEGFEGIFQIASFHPDYQFADTEADDPGNFTNRSPYPMLHILREDSLEQAIAAHPDIAGIPTRNIALMDKLGTANLKQSLQVLLQATRS